MIVKKITDLVFADYNPRKISKKEYKDLKQSLKDYGLVLPILINKNPDRRNVIIGGHQRVRAWQDLGNDTINCLEVDLSINDEMKLNLRLNKNGGKFDDDLLLNYFDEEVLLEVGFTVNDFDINIDKYEDNQVKEATKEVCDCCGGNI